MQNGTDAFSSILSDPRALASIAELLSNMQKAPPAPEAPSPAPAAPSPEPAAEAPARPSRENSAPSGASPSPDLSGMLGSLLSRPEVLSALPSVMSMLSGGIAGASPVGGASSPSRAIQATAQGHGAPMLDRRCALLSALKPYLPEDKRSAVDTVIRVIEIMSLIK